MVKKKSQIRKKAKKKVKKKQVDYKLQILKIISGFFVLLSLVIMAGLLAHHFLKQNPGFKSLSPAIQPNTHNAHGTQPTFEIFPKEKSAGLGSGLDYYPIVGSPAPKVAIIIDDLGYDRKIADEFINLGRPFTFSVLPYGPYQKSIIKAIHQKGFEIMLHLPLEPNEYPKVNPGPGALLVSMTPAQFLNQLEHDIVAVPYIKGVNNHMGSRITTMAPKMDQIFSVLKNKGLFFIDSRTTAETICKKSAALGNVLFAQRDIFLDHVQTEKFIKKQFKRLIRIAQHKGTAIGICHPHQITYEVIREILPEFEKKVELVPASSLVKIAG